MGPRDVVSEWNGRVGKDLWDVGSVRFVLTNVKVCVIYETLSQGDGPYGRKPRTESLG